MQSNDARQGTMTGDHRFGKFAAASLALVVLLCAGLPAAGQSLPTQPPAAQLPSAMPGDAPPSDRPDTSARPILDDATLRHEYALYLASIKAMRQYRVRYIRVADEAKARDLIARIRSGADFDVMARQHSTHSESAAGGGDLGVHASCRWAKATLQMLDSLKPGQTWPKPVKGTHGWGIYRLQSVTEVEARTFSQYKSELLAGKFEPECPWVPPVTIAPAPAGKIQCVPDHTPAAPGRTRC